MGLFDKNSKSNKTNIQEVSTGQNVGGDNSAPVISLGSISSGTVKQSSKTLGIGGASGTVDNSVDVNLSFSDMGAIAAGRDIALASLEQAGVNVEQTLDAVKSNNEATRSNIAQSLKFAQEANRSESEKAINAFVKLGIALVVGVAGVFIVPRFFKGASS